MKRIFLLLAGLVITLSAMAQDVSLRIKPTHDWLWLKGEQAQVDVVVVNNTSTTLSDRITLRLMTDTRNDVAHFEQAVSIGANDSLMVTFKFDVAEAGFYRCRAKSETTGVYELFNIGYDPEAIVSPADGQSDLKRFWDDAKAELKKIEPNYEIIPLPENSGNNKKLYLVKMRSLGGVEIQGYLALPTKEGKHPVVISYMGYGSKPWIPHPEGSLDYVEFVLSVRGQALNEPTNIYGDWLRWHLDDPSTYYYREAYMDLVRAIDFVVSLPQVDTRYIFAEGGSQGGAFTLAAAALDDRITAAAPNVPFLSDFADYFRIVHWPYEAFWAAQRELGLSNEELYRNISYFDIKNLAGWITCPTIMAFGMQDEICPPHTNFAGYNQIKSSKKYYNYPLSGHSIPGEEWWKIRMEFFDSFWK